MNQQQEKGGFVSYLIAVCLAAIMIFFDQLLRNVIWRFVKWCVRSAWAALRAKMAQPRKPKTVAPTVMAPELPTPDVFKGSRNLAPMKEFKW